MKKGILGIVMVMVVGFLVVGIAGRRGWFRVVGSREQVGHVSGAAAAAKVLELRRAVRAQDDVVAEQKKILDNIIRAKSVIYQGSGGAAGAGEDKHEEAVSQADRDLMLIERQINGLRYLEGDALMRHAAGIVVADNPVTVWLPEWSAAHQIVAANDGERAKLNQRLAGMERRMHDDVERLIRRLEGMRAEASARIEALERQQGQAVYRNANLRYEAERELLDWMSAKLRRMDGGAVSVRLRYHSSDETTTRVLRDFSLDSAVTDRRYRGPMGCELRDISLISAVTDRRYRGPMGRGLCDFSLVSAVTDRRYKITDRCYDLPQTL